MSKVVYLGGDAGAAWLDRIGVSYVRAGSVSDDPIPSAGLLLIGPDAKIDAAALRAYLEKRRQGFLLAAFAGRRRNSASP